MQEGYCLLENPPPAPPDLTGPKGVPIAPLPAPGALLRRNLDDFWKALTEAPEHLSQVLLLGVAINSNFLWFKRGTAPFALVLLNNCRETTAPH